MATAASNIKRALAIPAGAHIDLWPAKAEGRGSLAVVLRPDSGVVTQGTADRPQARFTERIRYRSTRDDREYLAAFSRVRRVNGEPYIFERDITRADLIRTFGPPERCTDCGVQPGRLHSGDCDVERCTVCKRQRLCCDCDGHNRRKARWTGHWPGMAECLARDWVLGPIPDLNRLLVYEITNNDPGPSIGYTPREIQDAPPRRRRKVTRRHTR